MATILALPDELLEIIMLQLPIPYIYMLATVCKDMRRVVKSMSLEHPIDKLLKVARLELAHNIGNHIPLTLFSRVPLGSAYNELIIYLSIIQTKICPKPHFNTRDDYNFVKLAVDVILMYKTINDKVYYSNSTITVVELSHKYFDSAICAGLVEFLYDCVIYYSSLYKYLSKSQIKRLTVNKFLAKLYFANNTHKL